MNRNIVILLLVFLAFGAGLVYQNLNKKDELAAGPSIMNFDECVAAGNPVQQTSPRTCIANGRTHTEDIGNAAAKQDLIRLSSPKPNDVVRTPLSLSGEARGNWFFEASFPVKILDSNGQVLGTGIAETKSNWMTDEFVPFTATLTFSTPTTSKGTLVLEKDNPSGLDENADSLIVPIKFP